jgi:hypothetical protein
MAIRWNRVTWYSKLLAIIVFAATFLIAFELGMYAEQVYLQAAITAATSAH